MKVMAIASAITPNAINVLAFVLTLYLLADSYPQRVPFLGLISSGLIVHVLRHRSIGRITPA